ncbi:MAG TPA: sigma-70 family RNA polymerase sigma factor [Kofleriaceae bacterium]|nr:sigma-70 family RNA polymerase sigma factor [Kofleriaceae bacterium]
MQIARSVSSELDEVDRCFDEARAAWPGIAVSFAAFAARLEGERSRANAGDLYLACACSDGNPLALAEFDRRFIGCVRDAVARIDGSYDFVAEVQQILRERLLVGAGAKIRDYRGIGTLSSWVRTAAVRTALNLRRTSNQQARHGRSLEPFEPLLDPEVALLRQQYAPEIDQALRRAIARLEPGERLLLHFYYVDGLTLARIAAVEHVGTTTVFRRLSAASKKVLAAVRADLSARLHLTTSSLDSLIRHVHHDVELSFSQILDHAAPTATDAPAQPQ